MSILLGILGLVSFIYYIVQILYAGIRTSFSLFWLGLAILMWLIAGAKLIFGSRFAAHKLPACVTVPIRTTIVLFAVIFLLVEGLIVSGMFADTREDLDYLIVLGAHVNGETVSKSLKYRLDTAAEYLEAHPDTRVIVSGGQGAGETISEAVAMKRYLITKGIVGTRIIMERYAENTNQNIRYSKNLLSGTNPSVGIVTNGFHVFRSVETAGKQGLTEVCGIAAPSDGLLLPNYLIREFLAVLKDKFLGNI